MTRLLRICVVGLLLATFGSLINCSKKSTNSPPTGGGGTSGQTPIIESVYPPGAHPGYAVKIQGQHFGATPDTSVVSFGGVAATQIDSWGDTEIRARVPGAAPTEMQQTDVAITVGGLSSAAYTFYRTPDKITRLTADNLDNKDPCWMGTSYICFVRYEVTPNIVLISNLWTMYKDGSSWQQRTHHDSITDYPSFGSPNTVTLAYRCKRTGQHKIYTSHGIGTEGPVTTGDLKDFQPDVAPGGGWYPLAVSRAVEYGPGVIHWEIHGVNGGFTQLTGGPMDFHPTWSGGGDSLAFERWNSPRGTQIHVLDVANDTAYQITELDVACWEPDWNPAYDWIAYWRTAPSGPGTGRHNIYMRRSDGTTEVALTTLRSQAESPSWAPDGKHIVYADRIGNVWDIYVVDVGDKVI